MKQIVIIAILLGNLACTRKTDYENTVDKFRSQTLGFYTRPEESPLNSEELKSFGGLHFFDINEQYNLLATIEWMSQPDTVTMKTSKDDIRYYLRVALLHFTIAGNNYQLAAYQPPDDSLSSLFVPFHDLTNGNESYGGGRYLDIEADKGTTDIKLDFNFSYVPYCAYSHRYSCPLVPAENDLKVRIEAGEKGI